MAAPDEKLENDTSEGGRVAKVIARSGLCSRREAEGLIEERRVSVNGAVIESAALDVTPADKVAVDGRLLSVREPPRLWRYHKPKGRVTTHKDPEGRPTVFEALPENLPRLISVGRLDFNTEGLLLLTNDGDLARHLELPSTGWTRRYRVRAHGQVTQEQLDPLADGFTAGKINYGSIEATLEREQGDNVWIAVSIREGKNREVRRIMEHLGLTVNRLIRVSFGPFMLGDLETGHIEEVKTAVLKDQLGPRLSRQLGVRRQPVREDRKLAPARAKPTYLRRKPGPEIRPEREQAERPLRRRRILPMDGSEAPKVEFVPERKPSQDRMGRGERRPRDGEAPRRSFEGSGEGDRPERKNFERRPRDGAAPQRSFEARGEGDRSERKSFGRPTRDGEAPRRSFAARGEGKRPERKNFGRPTRDGEAPRRSFAARGEGERPERKSFARPPRDGDATRRSFEERGEGSSPERKNFERRPRDGEAPRRSFEGRGEGGRPERKNFERRPRDGDAPRRSFEARGEGSSPERKNFERRPRDGEAQAGKFNAKPRPPRTERVGSGQDRKFTRERPDRGEGPGAFRAARPDSGDRKRFDRGAASGRTQGGDRRSGEGAPLFKRREADSSSASRPASFRPERRDDAPRPSRRAGEEGGRPARRGERPVGEGPPKEKSFNRAPGRERGAPDKRREGKPGFNRKGGDKPGARREGGAGKPFQRNERPARGGRPQGPRKPRPETDKERP